MIESFVSRLWQMPWLSPLNDVRSWNHAAQLINRLWSFTEVRAKVLRIEHECDAVYSLYLQPNRLFKGFTAGQHIGIRIEHQGVRHTRYFSLSDAPNRHGSLRVTIKVQQNGIVSKQLSQAKPGQIIEISQAQGDFVCEAPTRALLLLAAGSGITPLMAHLQHWARHTHKPDVRVIYSCTNPDSHIFKHELQTLVHQWPALRFHVHYSAEHGRLMPASLTHLVPDIASRQTLLCGPSSFMQDMRRFYQAQGLDSQLQQEFFGALPFEIDPKAASFTIFDRQAQARFSAQNGQSLLTAAEQQGLNPTHGCRRGICLSCQCKKISGVVHNQLTNRASGQGEEWIQLCITTPISDLQLEF